MAATECTICFCFVVGVTAQWLPTRIYYYTCNVCASEYTCIGHIALFVLHVHTWSPSSWGFFMMHREVCVNQEFFSFLPGSNLKNQVSSEPYVAGQQDPPLIAATFSKGLNQPTIRLSKLDATKYSSPVRTNSESSTPLRPVPGLLHAIAAFYFCTVHCILLLYSIAALYCCIPFYCCMLSVLPV